MKPYNQKVNPLLVPYIFLVLLLYPFCPLGAQTFTRITTGPVVTTAGDSRSVNWVDVNNDGLIDLFITNGPSTGQNNMLYMNNGGGTFTAVTADPIVNDLAPSDGATFADCDNDGDLDCVVANWYNINNLFYTNNGNGTFTENAAATVASDLGFSETASWGDYDKDGLVDLYVTNSAGSKKNYLYHNDGGGSYTKITAGPPVNDAFESRSVNWTDIDSDNDLDLFVTNESNENENIYRNDGTVFTALTTGPLLTDGGKTMSGSWGDYDNDGDMDVFLANDQGNNALFRNDGNFNFTKVADTVSNSNGNSLSSAWSDVDNDADLDLFVTNAFTGSSKRRCFMYLNNGNSTFSRVDNTAPATDSSWAYGCAFGDYDNDGFQDLAVATVRFAGSDEPDLLYHNDGNANTWISIKLEGIYSNKSAIGAKIRVKANVNGNPVWQLREISAQSSYCGQNDLRAHFGLGNATVIDSIKVEWPSDTIEFFTGVPINQFIGITEGQGITGMNEPGLKIKNMLVVFPNPISERLTISLTGKDLSAGDKVIIRETTGNTIRELVIKAQTKNYVVDLKKYSLANGSYHVSVMTKDGAYHSSFIKME